MSSRRGTATYDEHDFATGAVADGADAQGITGLSSAAKSQHESVEDVELRNYGTHLSAEGANLPAEHREYLMKRHGTLELDPMPGHGDADPYNWPKWKVMDHPSSSTQHETT